MTSLWVTTLKFLKVSTNDCGLFALAYTSSLRLKYNEFIDGDLREHKVPIISKKYGYSF